MPPSDAYGRSFLYLLYTLIKLYYIKALSYPALSLGPDCIRLLQRPRIPASYHSATTFHWDANIGDNIWDRQSIWEQIGSTLSLDIKDQGIRLHLIWNLNDKQKLAK